MAVACGNNHTVVIDENGPLFGFGSGSSGQLGNGVLEDDNKPLGINVRAPVRQIAAGWDYTGIVTEAGDLLMCGCGEDGQLGLGDKNNRTTPTLVERAVFDDESVLMVACGTKHTAVGTEGGGVYTFGNGEGGQLGHGNKQNELVPRRVSAAGFNGERIVMVAVGMGHTVALSEAGHVFTWGCGECGQLGHNDEENQLAPRLVKPASFTPELEFPGQVEKVVFVAAGQSFTVAVTEVGLLYTWGDNSSGQLGLGDTFNRKAPDLVAKRLLGPNHRGTWLLFGEPEHKRESQRVVMAACGQRHTMVVLQNGSLWACGSAAHGQLGLGDHDDRIGFVQVGVQKFTLRPSVYSKFGKARVVAAACGRLHSAAVTEDGMLWTWGDNDQYQLGHSWKLCECKLPRLVSTTHLQNACYGEKQTCFRDSSLGAMCSADVQDYILKLANFMARTGRCQTHIFDKRKITFT